MSDNYWTRRAVSRRALIRGAGLGFAGLAGAALIGCGDDDAPSGDGGTAGTGGSGGTATGTVAAPAATRGGELQVGVTYEPSTLDPQLAANSGDSFFFDDIFEGIVDNDGNGELDQSRSLSESYEIVDDTTITFRLREGVKFHDGTDFNAEAVVFSIERGQDPDLGTSVASALRTVANVEATDDRTVTFHLSEVNPALLNDLGGRAGLVLSPTAIEQLGEGFASNPVGTGAFAFQEYAPGSHVRVVRNENYWRKDANGEALPYMDAINIRTVLDATARYAALTTGDLHLAAIATQDIPNVEADDNLLVEERGGGTVNSSMLVFNPTVAPVDNINVRRAIAWAIDPEAANAAVYDGRSAVAKAFTYREGSWVYQEIPERPHYDPERAKQFLVEAGYPDGVTVEILTHSNPATTQHTEVYQEQLRQVGITVNLSVQAISQATEQFFQGGQTPIYSTTWGTTTSPDSAIRSTLDKDGFYNPTKSQDPDLQALIEEARSIYDQERRIELYNEIATMALDRCLFVPMLHGSTFVGVRKEVSGLDTLWTSAATWKYSDLSIG